jgi:hypothetical protein
MNFENHRTTGHFAASVTGDFSAQTAVECELLLWLGSLLGRLRKTLTRWFSRADCNENAENSDSQQRHALSRRFGMRGRFDTASANSTTRLISVIVEHQHHPQSGKTTERGFDHLHDRPLVHAIQIEVRRDLPTTPTLPHNCAQSTTYSDRRT